MLLVSYIFFCTRKSVKSLFTKKKKFDETIIHYSFQRFLKPFWVNNMHFLFNFRAFSSSFFLFSLVLILKRHQSVPLTDWWNHVMQSHLTLTNNHFLVQFLLLDNFIKFFPFQFEYIYFNLLKKCKQLLRYVIWGNNLLCNPSEIRDLCLMK